MKSRRPAHQVRRALMLAAAVPLLSASGVQAADFYWDNNGNGTAAGSWGSANNWATDDTGATSPATAAGASATPPDNAFFNVTALTSNQTVGLSANVSINSLTFLSAGSTTLRGTTSGSTTFTLTIGAGGMSVASGAGAVTFATGANGGANIALRGGQTWTNNSSSLVTVQSTISSNTGATSLTIDGSGNFSTSNITQTSVANALSITKNGAGVLTLGGTATSFSGGFLLNSGQVNINNSNALGRANNQVTIGASTGSTSVTIDNTSGSAVTTANFAQTWNQNFTFVGSNALNLGTGAVTLTKSLEVSVAASTLTTGGIIGGTGFGLTKAGAGTLALGGNNTFNGGISLNQGVINATAAGALGTGATTIAAGAQLNAIAGNSLVSASSVRLEGGTLAGAAAATTAYNAGGNVVVANSSTVVNNRSIVGTTGAGIAITLGSALALSDGVTLTATTGPLSTSGTATIVFGGTTLNGNATAEVINGASAATALTLGALNDGGNARVLTKTGNGQLNLNTAAASFGSSSSIVVGEGTLSLGNVAGAGLATITLGSTGATTSAALIGGVVGTYANAVVVADVDDAATLTLGNGGSVAAVFSGGVSLSNNLVLAGGGTGSVNVSGAITGSGNLSLNPSTTGTVTLSGPNSFTGNILFNAGTLNINHANALSSANLTINGGTLNNSGGATVTLSTTNAQAWNGDFIFAAARDLNMGTSTVTLGSSRVVTVNTGANGSILTVGAVGDGSNAHALTKAGTGSLRIFGNAGYGGNTTVSAGTLQFGGGGADITIATPLIDNAATVTFNAATLQSFGGQLSGAGGVNIAGAGTTEFTGDNSASTGTVTIGATARLRISSADNLTGQANVVQSSGGVLELRSDSGINAAAKNLTSATNLNVLVDRAAGGSGSGLTHSWGNLTSSATGSSSLSVTTTSDYVLSAGTISTNVTGSTFTVNANNGANVIADALIGTNAGTAGNVAFGGSGDITLAQLGESTKTFGTLTKAGSGTLMLDGNQTFLRGAITVQGGVVDFNDTDYTSTTTGNALVFSVGAADTRIIDTGTGTLTLTGNLFNNAPSGTNGIISGNLSLMPGTHTITVQSGATISVAARVSGTGGFITANNGNIVLSSSLSNYTGATTFQQTVSFITKLSDIGQASSIGAGDPMDNTTNAASLVLGGATLGADLTYVGTGDGTNRLFTMGAPGTVSYLRSSGSGPLNFTNTAAIAFAGTGTHALSLGGTNTGNNTFAPLLQDDASGATGLTKADAGRWILTNANTYTGGTAVTGGTLLVNNASGSGTGTGTVSVQSGGTLGGTGTITTSGSGLAVLSGGRVRGGDGSSASDDLAIDGNVTFNSGSVIELALDNVGNHSSLTRLGGGWTLTTDLKFSVLNIGAVLPGQTYDNVIAGLASDPFTSGWSIINPEWAGTFTYDGGGGVDLLVTATPEPGSLTMLGLGAAALLRRRRRVG